MKRNAGGEALRVLGREAKDREMELIGAELRIRGQRRLGEMLAETKATVGMNTGTAGKGRPKLGGTRKEPPKTDDATIAEWERQAGDISNIDADKANTDETPDLRPSCRRR